MTEKTTTQIPVFVYGSLRPGGNGAVSMMADASLAGPWEAHTTGGLYYHECMAYPVMDVYGDNLVRGDMYLVDEESHEWAWLWEMETEAGYVPTWTDVLAKQSDGKWAETPCIVFHWPHGTNGLVPVTDGDWLRVRHAEWPMGV